jgi:hypothetical protein
MIASDLKPAEKAEAVREAYRKHATELLAIEEAQMKLTTLLLAILGAGASFIAGMKQPLPWPDQVGLTIVIVAIVAINWIYANSRNNARKLTRELLVRCEEALGFQEKGVYIAGEKLYGEAFEKYPEQGKWLGYIKWVVVAAGIGFLIVLWNV